MKDYIILVDTREQKKLWNEKLNEVRLKKLDAGDYSISWDNRDFDDKIAIERKSLADITSTLTSGHTRFKKEIERAKKLDYFAVVVECDYSTFLKGYYRSSVAGYIVAKIAHTLEIKYGIPFHFCNSRTEAKALIRGLLTAYIREREKLEKEALRK